MNLSERAARALYALENASENVVFEDQALWEKHLPQIFAVIDAIREPSDVMNLLGPT